MSSIAQPEDLAGKTLEVQLVSKSTWPHCALGRFRLSATSDPSALARERLRIAVESGDFDGFAALAAAYELSDKQTEFDKLTREKPESLLGLAKFHADRQDRDRATAYYAKFLRSGGLASGLVFDGRSNAVRAPHVPFDAFEAFTVEAWFAGWTGDLLNQGDITGSDNRVEVRPLRCGWTSGMRTGQFSILRHDRPARWNHLAMVYDGRGTPDFSRRPTDQPRARSQPGHGLSETQPAARGQTVPGQSDSRRRFRRAGLAADFQRRPLFRPVHPVEVVDVRRKTVLLCDMSLTEDGLLRDASTNKRHATIYGPRWIVQADGAKTISPKTAAPAKTKK